MTTNVYQIWVPNASVPLMVFAKNPDDAALTYKEWRSIHYETLGRKPARVVEVSDRWLAVRPQLAAAAQRAAKITGDFVFYWVDHTTGWVPLPTCLDPAGGIAPYEPSVQYFVVKSDELGLSAEVFAHNLPQASQIYLDWQGTQFGKCEHDYTITPRSRWLLMGAKTALRAKMDLETVGIAVQPSRSHWDILPPDYEFDEE